MWAFIHPCLYLYCCIISNGNVSLIISISISISCRPLPVLIYLLLYYLTWDCIPAYLYMAALWHVSLYLALTIYGCSLSCGSVSVFIYIRPYPYFNCCVISCGPLSALICCSTAVLSYMAFIHPKIYLYYCIISLRYVSIFIFMYIYCCILSGGP